MLANRVRHYSSHHPPPHTFTHHPPELRHWYGTEYQFHGNPFSRACTLEERPVTPPSAMVTVILDDVPVEQVNQRLLEKR